LKSQLEVDDPPQLGQGSGASIIAELNPGCGGFNQLTSVCHQMYAGNEQLMGGDQALRCVQLENSGRRPFAPATGD